MFCECGCGIKTRVPRWNNAHFGWVAGNPLRFVRGHNQRGSKEITPANLHEFGVRTESGCLEWTRATLSGYGQMRLDGRTQYVTRVVVESSLGRKLRADEIVCHSCDNPPCFEPSHLYVGDKTQNGLDAARSGFLARRMTESSVREMRAILASGSQTKAAIARTFGVDRRLVRAIERRELWAWVD
jgi:hypothetical protein